MNTTQDGQRDDCENPTAAVDLDCESLPAMKESALQSAVVSLLAVYERQGI